MNPLVPAIATGLSGIFGVAGQTSANAANAAEARRNRQWQERMSNTAYQRQVADMRAAGLNPAMAYPQSGATTPGGGQARMEDVAAPGVSAARGALDSFNDFKTRTAQTRLTNAQARQLEIESVDRLDLLKKRSALTGTAAKFADETFFDRKNRIKHDTETAYNKRLQAGMETTQQQYTRPLTLKMLEQDLALSTTAAELARLELPGAQNRATAERSYFKKEWSPYLNDAKSLMDVINSLTGLSKAGNRRYRR